jgi:hypothetical protein
LVSEHQPSRAGRSWQKTQTRFDWQAQNMKQIFVKDPQTGKHRKRIEGGLFVHYPDSCNICSVNNKRTVSTARLPFAPRKNMPEPLTRLAPSKYGWVAICYEPEGFITFFVQINDRNAAWQRREWHAGFDKNWNEAEVKKTLERFLDAVARGVADGA